MNYKKRIGRVFLILGFFIQCLQRSYANDCSEGIGDFKFIAKFEKAYYGYLIAHEKDLVKINCSTSKNDAKVSLFVKDFEEDDKNILYSELFNKTLERNGETFTFTTEQEQNSFILECRAKTAADTICKRVGKLIVKPGERIAPVTLTPNVSSITMEVGDNLQVSCQARGHGTSGFSYIKWYKQDSTGKFLVDPSMVKRKSRAGIDIEVLLLRNASSGIQGVYICQRKTGDKYTEASFKVLYKDPETPFVLTVPLVEALKVREFRDPIMVKCVAIKGSPKPSLVWYRNNVPWKICRGGTNCMLNMTKPKYPDQEGNFTCVASNFKGSHSKSLVIKVLVPPVLLKLEEKKTEYTKVFDMNQDAELQCIVKRSNPLPTFLWFQRIGNNWTSSFKKVQNFPERHVRTNISKLVIPSSKVTSFFSCHAVNEAGSDMKNITVHWKGSFDSTSSGPKKDKMLVIVLSCSMIVILMILLLTYFYKRRLEKRYGLYLQPHLHFEFNSNFSLQEQTHKMPYDPKWEFPRDKLIMLEPIGSGAFGEVWLAKAQGILEFKAEASSMSPTKKKRMSRLFSSNSSYGNVEMLKNAGLTKVAVKTLKDNATDSEYKDLASELKILIHIGEHKNIVNLLGACTTSGNLCVILEYCPYGNLSTFLRGKRDVFEPTWVKGEQGIENMCTLFDLANFTYQISRGMDFLSSKKCIHRDLAARNILVSTELSDAFIVKVADFGMSRDVYRDGIYMKQSSGVLPLKWTAPESLADAIYTSQSDVWSYGVVLWEIFTLGGSPYPGIATDEFLSFLKSKKRMDQPDTCPDEFYKLMLDCWEDEPDTRPTFSKIYERIGDIIEKFADDNATYLRLENCPQKQESAENGAAQLDDDVFGGIESAETIELSIHSQQTNNSKSGSEYENLTVLKNSIAEGTDGNVLVEYVPMTKNQVNDVNDNIVKTRRETRDLLL